MGKSQLGTGGLIDVASAWQRICDRVVPLPPVEMGLAAASGRILAETVVADRDFPPADLSAMDGYAVRSAEASVGGRLRVTGHTPAGDAPGPELGPGCAVKVMTGACLPPGADAVIPLEDASESGDHEVSPMTAVRPGAWIRRQGAERRQGDPLLHPGSELSPAAVAILAAVGRFRVGVHPAPRVVVGATGDELLPCEERPQPWQVRNSNGPLLSALCRRSGGVVEDLGILPDRVERLVAAIQGAAAADVLLLSGGVSVGDRDLVPAALAAAGLQPVFHGVAVKPGKPILFAAAGSAIKGPRLAFGLPGNPLSALVGFLLFVGPALRRLGGEALAEPRRLLARLAAPLRRESGREEYRPVAVAWDSAPTSARPTAHPLPCHSSGDLTAVAGAHGFALVPASVTVLEAGACVDVLTIP